MRAIGVICLIAGLTGALSLANAADPDPFANVSVKSSLSGGSVYMLSGGGATSTDTSPRLRRSSENPTTC